jgi:cytochrome b-561
MFNKYFKCGEYLNLYFLIHSDYSALPAEGILINCIGILLVAFAGLVMYLVTETRYKRQPLPEDEMLLTSGLE